MDEQALLDREALSAAGTIRLHRDDDVLIALDQLVGGAHIGSEGIVVRGLIPPSTRSPRGLVFMDTPGYDPVSATGQVAGGANLICFTTGRGSAYGCAPSPSLKLATNSALMRRQSEDMDMNCGERVRSLADQRRHLRRDRRCRRTAEYSMKQALTLEVLRGSDAASRGPNTRERSPLRRLSLAGISAVLLILTDAAAAQPVPGNVDLSGDQPTLAAAVPVLSVDPSRHGHLAVAWRFIDPLGGSNARTPGNWICHLSTSLDDGKTFTDQVLHWKLDAMPRCNAPWVGFSAKGDLYVSATLTGMPPAPAPCRPKPLNEHCALAAAGSGSSSAPRAHPRGTVAFMVSHDGGLTWGAALSVIPSDAPERFAADASIPAEARRVPWDGARGAVDLSTGAIYLSGAFPAPPGAPLHSQRFYSASTDGGRSFGPIRAFGSADWPERWDGDIAAADGIFAASYIADSTPDRRGQCPCAVVGFSRDLGRTLDRRWLAGSAEFDLDTLVHYPEVAADGAHPRRFAVALVSSDRTQVSAFVTSNDGGAWMQLTPVQLPGVRSVTRPVVAFSPHGVLVLAWRGVHADGSYDIYAAASERGSSFGSALKVTTASSRTPAAWLKTYAVRGDFHTSAAADDADAHLAWADARGSRDVRVYYARVPLRALER